MRKTRFFSGFGLAVALAAGLFAGACARAPHEKVARASREAGTEWSQRDVNRHRIARNLATPVNEERPREGGGDMRGMSLRPGPAAVGVVTYAPEKCYNGYTLFSPRMGNTAYLVDMRGTIVHTWPIQRSQVSELLPNGVVVADYYNNGIRATNVARERVWTWDAPTHHDFFIQPGGKFLAVMFKNEPPIPGLFPASKMPEEIRTDMIWEASHEGEMLWEFDFGKHLNALHELGDLPLPLPEDIAFADYSHTNTVEALPDTPLGRKDPRFRAGNVLFSMRQLDIIGVIDRDKDEIVWAWGRGVIDGPHMPTMLPNGNILIFDNGTLRGYSAVIELNPATEEIVWKYEDPETFYSPFRAGADRLPNGNTLITSADQSRIFEVTPDKEIVWDYYSPFSNQSEAGVMSRRMYRSVRYAPAYVRPWLDERPDADSPFVPFAWLTDKLINPTVTTEIDGISTEIMKPSGPRDVPSMPAGKEYLLRVEGRGRLVMAPPVEAATGAAARTLAEYAVAPAPDRLTLLRFAPRAVSSDPLESASVRAIVKMGEQVVFDERLESRAWRDPKVAEANRRPAQARYIMLGQPQEKFPLTFIAAPADPAAAGNVSVEWGLPTLMTER